MADEEVLNNVGNLREYFSDDEHKVLLINDFLMYFADKCPNNRTMRRRFYRTMETLGDIMVQQGYWGENKFPRD